MTDLLKHHIEKKTNQILTKNDSNQFAKLVFEKSFDKKDLLAEEGGFCNYIYFIEQGSCYSFLTDEEGDKQVVQLALEDYWISDLYSFFSGKKAIYTIETLEPTKVLALNKEGFQKACDTIPVFDRFFRILLQNAYVALQQRMAQTNSEEAESRYAEFSKIHPDFIQRIPQYLIASFLGVKPESLSRIRKGIAKKG
jgi:CRP-like cAMP-binding protein